MATVGESLLHNTHCRSCHSRRWKTRMKMDGVITVGAEERSRLQRFPWHEQIDTTAPPPKCRVLEKNWVLIRYWWGFQYDYLQPPGPSGALPSPHSLLITVTPSKLPLEGTFLAHIMGETRPPGEKAAAVLRGAGVLIWVFVRAEFSTRPLGRKLLDGGS